MKTYKNKSKKNEIILSNIENHTSKKVPDLSIGNLHASECSTLSPTKDIAYKTIDDCMKDMICLSENSLEYDLYISFLKKKLIIIKAKAIRNECNKFKEENIWIAKKRTKKFKTIKTQKNIYKKKQTTVKDTAILKKTMI